MFSYNVIGAGAIGGYYGGRLAQAGREVHFLARSDAQYMKEHGLKVDSVKGNFELPNISVYERPEQLPRTDVVLISLKTTANKHLKEMLSPIVKPGTVVIVLQNGMGMENELSEWFPNAVVIGGMCFICSQKRSPGYVCHLDYGEITLGSFQEEGKKLLAALQKDFEESGIAIKIANNLGEARWRKLLWNIPYNGMCVVLDSDTKKIMNTPPARKIIKELMEEVCLGAKSCGFEFESDAVANMMAYTDRMTPYEPSMKLDYDARRPMEIEYMYRHPLAAAKEAGQDLPAISMLAELLEFWERRSKGAE